MIDRTNGFKNPHQFGQWLDEQQASDFLADVVIAGGEQDVIRTSIRKIWFILKCRKTPSFSYGDIRHVHRIYASN